MISAKKHILWANSPHAFIQEICDFEFDVEFSFFLDSILEDKFHVAMQRRNIGMTRFLAAYAAWRLVFGLDENIIVITPNQAARSLFRKHLDVIVSSIDRTGITNRMKTTSRRDSIEFGNNRLSMKAASEHAGRGEMTSLVILEGFGEMKDAKEIWMAIWPSLGMGEGDCIITNPWSIELRFFGDIWKSALKGDSSFVAHYI